MATQKFMSEAVFIAVEDFQSVASRYVPERITTYANKCRSELCRNCVRSPRNYPQTPTFTGSHQEAFCGGKSLNRLREEMFWYHPMWLAGIVFQACSFNHSDISPCRINKLRAVAANYRTRRSNSGIVRASRSYSTISWVR